MLTRVLPVHVAVLVLLRKNEAYDKTQGSEVKEKEKARHQTSASS